MKNYQRILSGVIEEPDQHPDFTSKKSETEIVQKQAENKEQLVGNNKLGIQAALGEALFRQVYEFLKFSRRKGTDEALIHAEIKRMVGGDRRLLNFCFNLDGIVFMELLKEQQ
jgi:hypothetical protein